MEQDKRKWATGWLSEPKRLYINGQWTAARSGKAYDSLNPVDGQVLASLQDAGTEDVEIAADAALTAFRSDAWAKMSRKARAERLIKLGALIREHRAELATLETLDNGKTYKESYNDDLPESADVFDYYAGWIDKLYGETAPVERGFLNFTRREPVGVCALLVPWNFPLLLACWKIAPALAMGNTVLVKPSPFTSLTLVRLAELIHAAQIFPPGVFNVLTGGAECGQALAQSRKIAKISFTGSTEIGKKIVESAGRSNLKSVALELGGKSPNILFEDTPNLDAVIDRAYTAMFSHKGEKCSEPTRLLVHETLYHQVVEKLVEKAKRAVVGCPFDEKTEQGPQAHKAHFEKVREYIRIGKEEGATLLVGGENDPSHPEGYFIRPVIFGDVTSQMRLAREEIFGPVLAVLKFKTEAQAIQSANDSDYGLAAGLYTSDISRAHRVANALDAGMVFINHYGCYDFSSPFGGFKESGWGKEMAVHSLDSYTRVKSVWVRYE